MKKIDRLYMLIFSVTLLLISIISYNLSFNNLKTLEVELIDINNIGIEYSNTKKDWGDRKQSILTIEKIIKSTNLKTIDKKILKNKIKIKIENVSLKTMDKFVNKILNAKLNIIKLNITKNSVELEVGI
jgi:hypothetical protein